MNHVIVSNGIVEVLILAWDWEKIYPIIKTDHKYPTIGHFEVEELEHTARRLELYANNSSDANLVKDCKKFIFVLRHSYCQVEYLTQKIRIKRGGSI